jgi:hypothetical protein
MGGLGLGAADTWFTQAWRGRFGRPIGCGDGGFGEQLSELLGERKVIDGAEGEVPKAAALVNEHR